MSKGEDYRPRLSVEISQKHQSLLLKHFGEYRAKKDLVFIVLEDVFRLIEKHGASKVIGALASRMVTLNDICKLKLEE